MPMSLDDRYFCRMITDLKENIHGLYSGFASEDDYLKAINECHDTEEKLKELLEEKFEDDDIVTPYFDATLKRYDVACETAIKAIEERSGEKYDPAYDKALQEDLKNRLQQMLVEGMMKAMAESNREDTEETLDNFVKRMKELEDEKNDKAGDDEK